MSEISTNARYEDVAKFDGTDEIAAVFERRRSERATGAVNTSPFWQVRIGWGSTPPMAFPPFSFDAKDSREDAEHCARHATTWQHLGNDLHVVSACVRGPGESEWRPVTLPQAVSA